MKQDYQISRSTTTGACCQQSWRCSTSLVTQYPHPRHDDADDPSVQPLFAIYRNAFSTYCSWSLS